MSSPKPSAVSAWTPDSWTERPEAQAVPYADTGALGRAKAELRRLPPLVTSFEIERLKGLIADAQAGRRFVLQGGDCAETLADCESGIISNKLKILLQMSLVLVHGTRRPVVRIGRFAGQYAKPRSKPEETRADASGNATTLPSFFGDMVNRAEFTPEARAADPALLLEGYKYSALTLNFIRSLSDSGFADLHHPEYWDLSFMESAKLSAELRGEYQRVVREVGEALRFMQALGEQTVDELTRVEFFTSHEGLNLHYESAQTRRVPRRDGWYDLTTHLPWIGERTRGLDGAHVEFFRGVRNPVGIKIGPKATPDDVLRLVERLNPTNEAGKILLVLRLGADAVERALPPLVTAVRDAGQRVLWMSDPMHGNTVSTSSGRKTRDFEAILTELLRTLDVHEASGTHFGGVHFELTGDDVTECTGGAEGLGEEDLERNYLTACDPRLNYRQALEMSLRIAQRMRRSLEP
ncbi:MAG: 3-deoxy-7-phosphoheptulonate synthase [Myxococcales bacterium]|nr:3-deoxy-7-phosphoheptulonate synthase [Myxococcales bacterium]